MKNSLINKIYKNDDFEKLNSLTKYPSILTYHELGDRGTLKNTLVENKFFGNEEEIYVTEKIDGSNSRIIFSTNHNGEIDDYLLGSREELLFAMGDRTHNDKLGIVETVVSDAEAIKALCDTTNILLPDHLYVVYGETYGGTTKSGKNYSSYGNYNYRVFDFWKMEKDKVLKMIEEFSPAEIALWRDKGGQPFATVEEIKEFSNTFYLSTVPYLKVMSGKDLPIDLMETYEWMKPFIYTTAAIDDYGNINNSPRKAEGVVVRTKDRSLIRKLRFPEYNKTFLSLKLD